ncbi:hypothetical protein, partial [Providencia stuartii]|uniref:hypothetical protein n=1 Tax=Providencia stuartii TaxID=588 RepID=UPI002AA0BF69
RNLEAICAAEGEQIDLMLLVEDKAEIANSEERAICQQLRNDLAHSIMADEFPRFQLTLPYVS